MEPARIVSSQIAGNVGSAFSRQSTIDQQEYAPNGSAQTIKPRNLPCWKRLLLKSLGDILVDHAKTASKKIVVL